MAVQGTSTLVIQSLPRLTTFSAGRSDVLGMSRCESETQGRPGHVDGKP